MAKLNFFGWLFGAAKDAQSPEGLEAKALQELEAQMAENETLKAQISEMTEKYKASQSELDKAKAEASEIATLREDLERYKNLPAANSVADEVKGGFTPSAGGQGTTKFSWQEKFEKGEI